MYEHMTRIMQNGTPEYIDRAQINKEKLLKYTQIDFSGSLLWLIYSTYAYIVYRSIFCWRGEFTGNKWKKYFQYIEPN